MFLVLVRLDKWCHEEIRKTEKEANLGGQEGGYEINSFGHLRILLHIKVEMLSRQVDTEFKAQRERSRLEI